MVAAAPAKGAHGKTEVFLGQHKAATTVDNMVKVRRTLEEKHVQASNKRVIKLAATNEKGAPWDEL